MVPMASGGMALTYALAFLAYRAGVHTALPYLLGAVWYAALLLAHVVEGH